MLDARFFCLKHVPSVKASAKLFLASQVLVANQEVQIWFRLDLSLNRAQLVLWYSELKCVTSHNFNVIAIFKAMKWCLVLGIVPSHRPILNQTVFISEVVNSKDQTNVFPWLNGGLRTIQKLTLTGEAGYRLLNASIHDQTPDQPTSHAITN